MRILHIVCIIIGLFVRKAARMKSIDCSVGDFSVMDYLGKQVLIFHLRHR